METKDILMTTIPTIAIAIVGIVLSRQVKSQNQIIANMKLYMDTISVDEFKKHVALKIENITMEHAKDLRKFQEDVLVAIKSAGDDFKMDDKGSSIS